MGAARPVLGLVSLVLIAGACLLMLLVLLGGTVNHGPINEFYFLQADTSKIPGAAPQSRWTFWNTCSVDASGRNACPKVHPAYPLDPTRNFGTSTGVPPQFMGTHKYYYLTRFMFAFMLIGLVFSVCALFVGVLALCSRIGSFLSSATASVGLFFQTLTAALMTAAYVKGQNNFKSAGVTASIGKYNFGFMWAAVACLFISMVLLCAGGAASSSGGGSSRKEKRKSRNSAAGGSFGGGGRGKKGPQRDRGSFIDRSSFEKDERPLPLTNGM